MSAHPRRRLSWRTRHCRTPSSGCGSGRRHAGKTYFWNRRTNSTVWQSSSWCRGRVDTAKRNEEGRVWYWHRDTRVSPRLTALFFLLGEERYHQPRAVFKYCAPRRLCCVEILFTVNNGHWSCYPRGTLVVLEAITLVQLIPAHGCTRTSVRSGLRSIPSPSLLW